LGGSILSIFSVAFLTFLSEGVTDRSA